MSSGATLTQNCSICFKTTPKYRCPRCSARTCSLACVKTHKARNLCSGVRESASFLSRRELATSKSFDSDFNLLSSIERGVERAERTFGLHSNEDSTSKEKKVLKAIQDAGVRVWQAPKGVKRWRDNATSIEGRRKCLIWTIEWKHIGITLLTNASEIASLAEAHNLAILDMYCKEEIPERKTMLRNYAKGVAITVPEGYKGRKELITELGLKPTISRTNEPPTEEPSAAVLCHSNVDAQSSSVELEQIPDHSQGESVAGLESSGLLRKEDHDSQGSPKYAPTENGRNSVASVHRKFFIHRPDISTAQKQMVSPVDGLTSLRDILRGKTVREFPTFLVDAPYLDEVDWTKWHLFNEDQSLIVDGV